MRLAYYYGNVRQVVRFKMAACSSKEGVRVENNENYDEIMKFESCVDEHEALVSLGDLLLSDDEYFVDLDVDSGAESSDCPSAAQLASALASTPGLACLLCGKTYKIASFLWKHREKCKIGGLKKRAKLSATTDSPATATGKFASSCHIKFLHRLIIVT